MAQFENAKTARTNENVSVSEKRKLASRMELELLHRSGKKMGSREYKGSVLETLELDSGVYSDSLVECDDTDDSSDSF